MKQEYQTYLVVECFCCKQDSTLKIPLKELRKMLAKVTNQTRILQNIHCPKCDSTQPFYLTKTELEQLIKDSENEIELEKFIEKTNKH